MPDDATATVSAPTSTLEAGRRFFDAMPAEDLRFLMSLAGPLLVTTQDGRIWWLNQAACELLQTDIDSACDYPRFSWVTRFTEPEIGRRYLSKAKDVARGNGEASFTNYNDLTRLNSGPIGVEVVTYRIPSTGPFRFFVKTVTPMAASVELTRAIGIMSSQLARIEGAIAEDVGSRLRMRGYVERVFGVLEKNPKLTGTVVIAILTFLFGPGSVNAWRDFFFGPKPTPVYQSAPPPAQTQPQPQPTGS